MSKPSPDVKKVSHQHVGNWRGNSISTRKGSQRARHRLNTRIIINIECHKFIGISIKCFDPERDRKAGAHRRRRQDIEHDIILPDSASALTTIRKCQASKNHVYREICITKHLSAPVIRLVDEAKHASASQPRKSTGCIIYSHRLMVRYYVCLLQEQTYRIDFHRRGWRQKSWFVPAHFDSYTEWWSFTRRVPLHRQTDDPMAPNV